jgi:hypothetical protein
MYCMFFERYGDVVVRAVLRLLEVLLRVPEVPSTVKLLAYSCTYSRLIDFDRRLKTFNEKFIRDFVMVNMFYIHYCRPREYYNRVVRCTPKQGSGNNYYRNRIPNTTVILELQ